MSGNELFRGEKLYDLLVAKCTQNQTWLPYDAHLLDTAGVMGKLVNHWLPANIAENIMAENPSAEL